LEQVQIDYRDKFDELRPIQLHFNALPSISPRGWKELRLA
jgi:hypothetical protein